MVAGKKECVACRESKPLSEFYKRSDTKSGSRGECRECTVAYMREYRLRTRDVRRCQDLRRRYGIDAEEYKRILAAQDYCCAICGAHKDDSPKRLYVDHCHESNHVRGLLCQHCNLVLGHAKDDTEILWNAIDYLDKHQNREE